MLFSLNPLGAHPRVYNFPAIGFLQAFPVLHDPPRSAPQFRSFCDVQMIANGEERLARDGIWAWPRKVGILRFS
ncbi:MAG: hypothetical protein DMG31_07310 [Acidobacteria bacterium]|nr:MAG: hypothetical protein DMG31_07310 [Acidobacteriota bacterium]